MNKRINYRGGADQQNRMIKDKLNSLERALKYSYQGATVIVDNSDKEFRCLINPSKVNISEDIKILSIPFQTVDSNGNIVATNIHPGSLIEWKENSSFWLVYNQHLEEYAYFRGELRKCNQEAEYEGYKFKVAFEGPDESKIDWKEKSNNYFNTLNYTATIYVAQSEAAAAVLKRFAIITIGDQPWEVQSVDKLTNPGLITIHLKEWYNNTAPKEEEPPEPPEPTPTPIGPHIEGPTEVKPFSNYTYTIVGYVGGHWSIDQPKKLAILSQTDTTVDIGITTGRSGNAMLTYTLEDHIVNLPLTIVSL